VGNFIFGRAMDEIEITSLAGGDVPRAELDGNVIFGADLASTFIFASHQNAIPVIRSIRIENSAARRLPKQRSQAGLYVGSSGIFCRREARRALCSATGQL
jgi:hypothetical protein